MTCVGQGLWEGLRAGGGLLCIAGAEKKLNFN